MHQNHIKNNRFEKKNSFGQIELAEAHTDTQKATKKYNKK